MKILFSILGLMILSFSLGYFVIPAKSQDLDTSLPHPTRDIYLRGEITEPMAFKIGEEIAGLNASGNEEITLHITSLGGEVYAGLQIYDYMMESKTPIRVSCEGYCMSMAAYLLASAKIRQSDPHATIMFHQIMTESKGHINEVIMDLLEAQRLQAEVNTIVSKRTGLSKEALDDIESYDDYMSPQECKKLNLIDIVIGE